MIEGQGGEKTNFIKGIKHVALGFEFLGTAVGGLFLGYLLDLYLDTSPWFTTTITLLALVGAFIRLIQWSQRLSGEDK